MRSHQHGTGLPLELLAARRLRTDQAELVVDEAMDYLVTEHTVPIYGASISPPRGARTA